MSKEPSKQRIDEAAAATAFDRALTTYSQGFGTFFLARLLDLEIRYEGQTCVIEMELRDFMFNPQGSLHGGIISTVLDISMGHLLHHAAGAGVTLEMKVQFLRPVRSGRVRCQAGFIKQGRSVNYLQSTMTDAEQRAVAMATSTWQLLARADAGQD